MSRDRPPGAHFLSDALKELGPFESIEEANRVLAKRMREYNSRPQAELGGLSSDTMYQLLYGDWKSDGALRLDSQLTLDDLASSAILADARTVLEYVQTEGPVKETPALNLTRAAVASLLPHLRIPKPQHITRNDPFSPPVNEGDVPWLSDVRYVLMLGKLLARRKGLRITPLGRELLSPDRAGELYTLIFWTYFRRVDLSALAGGRHQALQSSLAYSFYKLHSAARDWTSPEALAQQAWLESAKDPPGWMDLEGEDLRFMTFEHRVLDPLVHFGLLEVREVPSGDPWPEVEYRCAPLFARFLRFELR